MWVMVGRHIKYIRIYRSQHTAPSEVQMPSGRVWLPTAGCCPARQIHWKGGRAGTYLTISEIRTHTLVTFSRNLQERINIVEW